MSGTQTKRKLAAAFLAQALASATLKAGAATIIANAGGSPGASFGLQYQYGSDPNYILLSTGWSTALSYSGVSISAQIGSNNPANIPGGATGRAYLTTQIGTGTTVSNQVAAASFAFPSYNPYLTLPTVTLFTDLTLSAGTPYFLTIIPDAGISAGWQYGGTSSSDDPGLTTQPATGYFVFSYDNGYSTGPGPASYSPASNFLAPLSGGALLNFSVTGTPTPEPSTLALFGIGLALLSRRHRETRK